MVGNRGARQEADLDVADYFKELDRSGNTRSLAHIYNQRLIRKTAYFIQNPQYFAHSWDNYGIALMFDIMMSMRSYVMRQRISRGEMPPVWNKCQPSSAGYYKLPKPMKNPAMILLAAEIYELVYDDTMLYISRFE